MNDLVKIIEKTLVTNWSLEAISNYQKQTLLYSDVAKNITFLHHFFQHLKVKKGEKIALIGKNSVQWAITYLATITYGAVIVPILPDFAASDIHHIVNHSDAVLLFSSSQHYDLIDETKIPAVEGIISLEDYSLFFHQKKNTTAILQKAKDHFLSDSFDTNECKTNLFFEPIDLEETMSIVYTSGTTGFSKGVMLPHRSLLANVLYAQQNMPLKPADKIVSFMPLAHAYGCAFEFLFPFTLGCHITFLTKIPSPKIIVKAFNEIRPQLILSVPLIIEKIYNKQLKPVISTKKVKLLLKIPGVSKIIKNKISKKLTSAFGSNFIEIVIGGAALNGEVEKFLQSIQFPFTIGYGMTECGPLISYIGWDKRRTKCVGKVVNSLRVKIDSPDPQNIVGEIMVKGENVMLGYYKNEEITQETITKDGWLHTGDLGIIDEDGFIYIKGRKKNMLLGPSGQNIYPEEIESKLNNLPYIQESLVLEKRNQLIAYVYPDMELIDKQKIKEKEVQTIMEKNKMAINAELPTYSKIIKMELSPQEFEKTPTKKIKRFRYE